MRLVCLLIALLFPAVAHAGAAIGIAAIVASMAGASAVVVGSIMIASIVFGAVEQRRKSKKEAAKARRKYNDSLQDQLITDIATDAPHRYVYGKARVGSIVVAVFTSGGKDEYKHIVCVHAAHECDAVEEIWIAGKKLGNRDSGGLVTSGPFYSYRTENISETKTGKQFDLAHDPVGINWIMWMGGYEQSWIGVNCSISGRTVTVYDDEAAAARIWCNYNYAINTSSVRVRTHLGAPDDPVDAYLHSLLPGQWPATSVLRGFCYSVVTLNLNESEFQGGIPAIEVVLRGKKLYDPRTDTAAWSDNNALVAYDYLRSEICNVDASDIPLSSVIAAANVCDETFSFGKRYTFNGTVTADQDQADVLEGIAQSMAGGIVANTWDIWAGKYVAPVMDLTDADIVGEIAVTPGISDADLYNGVRGQYMSVETQYASTDFKPYQNKKYVEEDNGRELWTDIDFPYTDTVQRVHNICRILTEGQRDSYIVRGMFSLKAFPVRVGQRIRLSSRLFGWNNKIFRLTDRSFTPGGAVEMTLKEDDSKIWDFADAVVADQAPNTNLPDPWSIAPIKSLTCDSGTNQLIMGADGTIVSRILVQWPETKADIIELQWIGIDEESWQSTSADGEATAIHLSPVRDGVPYTIRARAVNAYFNVRSDWVYATHTAVGKLEPPPNVRGFLIANGALLWQAVNVIDLLGYEIRFHYGDNDSWFDATPLHIGVITESPFTPEITPPGELTLMIKAIDRSMNYSDRSAVIYHRFGDVIVDNLILEYDDKAAGFPGQKINCSVVGENLMADDSGDLFWGADNARFYGADGGTFWPQETWKQMEYVLRHTIEPEEAESRLTLRVDVTASAYTIEYRYETSGLFWDDDNALFWRDDSEYFWPEETEWKTWPGELESVEEGIIEIRITTQEGHTRGVVSEFTLQFDVEDEYEELNDIHVTPAGTRLPVQKTYRAIKNIQLTLQDTEGDAVTAKWADKLATGPLIHCLTAAGVKTSGTVDARIQGVKGKI